MKRAEKIALLTKVLQGDSSTTNRQRLQHAKSNGPQSLIIIDDLDFQNGQTMSDNNPVHFYNKGKEHRMTLGEAYQYANRYEVGKLFILPAKR